MANDSANVSLRSPLGRRLWWLIGGRATGTVLLLLIGAAWKWNTPGPAFGNAARTAVLLILSVAGLTVIYSLARVLWKNYLVQAQIQFIFDVLLVTWLVWITGNANSAYAGLYIVIISVASLYVGPRGAIITSIGCV